MARLGKGSTYLRWLPLAVLLLGLLVTLGTAYSLSVISQERATLRFENAVEQTRAAMKARLATQISLLQGVVGLFAASNEVTKQDFAQYVKLLQIPEHYPGVQGVGFSARVPAAEHDAFLKRVRGDGQPYFQIWPQTPRDEYHTILFLEPLDARNQVALGYDMFTEPTRRAAMERARDSGQPAMSGKVLLVQEIDQQKQAGFLIYVPIYRGGLAPSQLAERRSQLVGFAYSPFRADDLFDGIFDEHNLSRISFAIYDGATPTAEALLHTSDPLEPDGQLPPHTSSEVLDIAGRRWLVVYRSLPSFEATSDAYIVPVVVVFGTLTSVVMFLLVQAQTTAYREAEQALKARDTFLSVASHELKTPLTALMGNAMLLQRRTTGKETLTPGEHRNIQAMVEGSRRLSKLVDELLDHTRLNEGRLQLDLQPLDLRELVAYVVEEIRPTLQQHRVVIHDSGVALPVVGDPLRLEQVLRNLINNGVKYSPRGGTITVELAQDGTWALIRVCDEGIGIPAAALPQLFEQFYRAPNAAASSITGMGIGLHVVKTIVERHDGSISVESSEGQGSTFSVRLPLAEASRTLNAPAPQSEPHLRLPRP